MEMNGWEGWAFGQPNHPYPAATWGASHYRKASDRFIGTQVPIQNPRCYSYHSYQVLHTRKVRRGKGGQVLRPPLSAHADQSGLQETFWYNQVVSDEETPTLDQIPGVERQLRRNGTLSTSALGTDAWTVHYRDTSTSPGRIEAVAVRTSRRRWVILPLAVWIRMIRKDDFKPQRQVFFFPLTPSAKKKKKKKKPVLLLVFFFLLRFVSVYLVSKSGKAELALGGSHMQGRKKEVVVRSSSVQATRTTHNIQQPKAAISCI
ncbi:hypothetical protein GGI43DRAFT_114479 [Trichoderma evansii]